MRILLIEDDRRLSAVIQKTLRSEGFVVDAAYTGDEGVEIALRGAHDAAIVDWMLPGRDGPAVCQAIRAAHLPMGLLMLTARSQVEDRVAGLDSGADDYLVKPFAFTELLARVRALLRREVLPKPPKLQVGDLVLDVQTREVRRGQRKIELTAKEYAILEYFMRRPNAVVTRTKLGENVWDYEFDGISNIIDVYVRRLRSKIDEDGETSFIQTLRGAGYRLRAI